MATIEMITKDDDIKELIKNSHKFNWDIVIEKNMQYIPYQVYDIPSKVHTIKGMHNKISFWGHPLCEEPTYKNLIPMNLDHIISWSMNINERHEILDKFRTIEEITHRDIELYRNGRLFCTVPCSDITYGLAEVKTIITYLEEGPINIFERGFDQKLIGRKVIYKGKVYSVKRYIEGRGCVVLHPRFETSKGYEEPILYIWDKSLEWD